MKKEKISPLRLKYIKKQRFNAFAVHGTRVAALFAFIALWELFARQGVIDAFLFSSPSRIIKTIKNLVVSGEIAGHIFTTVYETVAGFIIATALGSAIALALWWSEFLRKTAEPYVVVLNSLPKIALGPIIIVWFGAGKKSIIFMAVIITVIVTVITMLNGFLATDEGKLKLMRSLGASKFTVLRKLVIPYALPTFTACMKINVGLSWIGSIMGEYLTSKEGIGYLIVYGGQVFKLDLVMASTAILCVLAAGMYLIIAVIEKFALKWQR